MTPTMQNPAAMPNPIAIQNPIANTSFLKGLFGFDNFIAARLVKIFYAVGAVLILLVTGGGGLLLTVGELKVAYRFYTSFSGFVYDLFYIVRMPSLQFWRVF